MDWFPGQLKVEDAARGVPQAGDDALHDFSQVRLELGEGLFDWVEVEAF